MICSVCRRIGGTHFRPLFMPATQSFCPLRKSFARFSDFWSRVTFYRRFARFLRQICGWTTPVGLTCCYDSSSCHQSIPPRGGALPRFHRSHCWATQESPLARCRAPIVSTKALLAGFAVIFSRWSGTFSNFFGPPGEGPCSGTPSRKLTHRKRWKKMRFWKWAYRIGWKFACF